MPPRRSKRLQDTIEKAVTTVAKQKKSKVSKELTKSAESSHERIVQTTEKATVATTTTSKGRKSTKSTTKATTTSQANAQQAWGDLFKKKPTLASPKASGEVSSEMQQKIEQYAADHFGDQGMVNPQRSKATKSKIVAWNVNGLRALLKKDDSLHFRGYVHKENPDVLCLSETKICAEELAKLENVLPQFPHHYWSCAQTKKGYSGTVVFTKTKPLNVLNEIMVPQQAADEEEAEADTNENNDSNVTRNDKGEYQADLEGRFLALEFANFWLVHTYVPNAGMKLDRLSYRTKQWDAALLKMLKLLEEKGKSVIWCGDLNVAHQEIDIHDPKANRNKSPGFTDAERESFGRVLSNGFVDTFRHFYPETQQYTYWSYRFQARQKNKGWRLDYFVVSQKLLEQVQTTYVRDQIIGSDHVPIGIELKVPL